MKKTNSVLNQIKGHLMTGISYMLPLIIGASLVVAVPKLLGLTLGITDFSPYAKETGFYHILYLIEQAGWTGVTMVNTILGGFIAYSIGDKPGMAAGFVGGLIASNTNEGFLGAVVAGFAAGYIAKFIKEKVKITGAAASMVPLIILPLVTVGSVGILMNVILAGPLSSINNYLLVWVKDMCSSNTNVVVLAAVLGAMIAFDLGGPVNKAAWMAGNVLFLEGIYLPSIFINCAILIPPLGYGIATLIKKSRFSSSLREAGKGNIIMGIIGITEGAIPFTLCNPLKLVPVNIIGCSLGAAVTALLGAHAIMPPIGGLYGFISLGSGWAYLVGSLVGALTIAILAVILVDFNDDKKEQSSNNDENEEIILEM